MADDQIIQKQFEQLASIFRNLNLEKRTDGVWLIGGRLGFAGDFPAQSIEDEYEIAMTVPKDYPINLPEVWETGDRIPLDYHKNPDKSLCLGAPLAVKTKFNEEPTLSFVSKSLIPFLYSFSFYDQHGCLPFGELSHGAKGLFEYYKGLFHLEEDDNSRINPNSCPE